MDNPEKDMVPENEQGAKTDTFYAVDLKSLEEAKRMYEAAKHRLLNISAWHTYAGTGTADFKLTDQQGNLVQRLAQERDHFQIEIPGPGSKTGDGFDWVQIESIEENHTEDCEFTAIKVRPATNPNNRDSAIAHFFDENASSTFIVKREGLTLNAEVHGRNEKLNTNTENIVDKARNIMVAAGAMLGFSNIQWKSLTRGLLTHEKSD
jgi:hypothetical protein